MKNIFKLVYKKTRLVSKLFIWLIDVFLKNIILNGFTKKIKLKKNKDEIVLLANGPSLKDKKEEIKSHIDKDFLCVNFFPNNNEMFWEIKPRYIVMIDPRFYNLDNEEFGDQTKKLISILERVDWEMYFVNFNSQNLEINNSNIKNIKLNNNKYHGEMNNFFKLLFDNNLSCPLMHNVMSAAIYFSVLLEHKSIYLYGLDMTFYQDIYINKNNHLIMEHRHFYGSETKDLTAIGKFKKGEAYKFFEEMYDNFYSFASLKQYAEMKNINIYNCNPNSQVDSFEKIDFDFNNSEVLK